MKDLIAEKVDRAYAERAQAEGQNQIEDTLFDMLQHGNSAASNGSRPPSVRFLETVVAKLFSGVPGDDIMSNCSERWTKSDKSMNAVVK